MPRNTFLKTPQPDFSTAAESCWVSCTKIILYFRKAVTVWVLLLSERQLQCIGIGHLAGVFPSEWNRAMAKAQALPSSHPCILIAGILSGIDLICSNLASSQAVCGSALSQQYILGSVANRHFRSYCTILRMKRILAS